MKKVKKALTIAGSDSGAGAGIQADLKTFAALGVYGTSVITAITAQNTAGVLATFDLPCDWVAAQIDAVAKDIGTQAVKTGMLANSAIVSLVAEKIREHRLANVVVDPVLNSKGGKPLLSDDAVETLCGHLLPLATMVTPNIPEAERLTGIRLVGRRSIRKAAERILAMGPRSVVIKGGHRTGPATDFFYDGRTIREITARRVRTRNTHGTGCTFSAAIAANLAKGMELEKAVVEAKRYVTCTIRASLSIGKGRGPLHHFYFLKRR
jgi:hydroxymethylpyrimidine/phosphomethylpyrimidine kinase